MHIIQLDKITVNYMGRIIFTDLSYAIGDQDRVGLVGPNGAGKSTLFKAIVGQIPLESGVIITQRGIKVGYLPQDIELPLGKTLLDITIELPPDLAAVEKALAKIDAQLGDPVVYGDEIKLAKVLARQEELLDSYETLGGAKHRGRVLSILNQLGFDETAYDLLTDNLSGGQKKLVALAKLAIEMPQVLLLDEPDNHLDVQAKENLERFIRNYEGAVIIISHDRYLLDEVVNQIAELASGKLTIYTGNYTAYVNERELQRLRQQQMYVAQQKEIARIEAAIARFELWASLVVDERHIKQARSRRRFLDKLEANGEIIEKVTERRLMGLQLNGGRGSQKAIEAKNLTMGFGDDLLLMDLNFLIRHGERVGVVGANGSGKSVLFKLILGEYIPLDGEIIIGPSTRIGYYSQEHQTLAEWWEQTPIACLRDIAPLSESDAVGFLLKFAFQYEQTRQPIKTLSGGERSRLQLAVLMLMKPNLLLLDEPTNNLDIQSVEVLETALDEFDGAVVVISHDRYFLDQVIERILELRDGEVHEYLGGYTDYIEQKQQRITTKIGQRSR